MAYERRLPYLPPYKPGEGYIPDVVREKNVKPAKPVKTARPPKPMSFETAMRSLRRGRAIRRRSWHSESMIFRLGADVFLKLPDSMYYVNGVNLRPVEVNSKSSEAYGSAPTFWKPYPSDFLASDWQVVK